MVTLHRLGADEHLKNACRVQVTKSDPNDINGGSQVIPPRHGFRRGHCTIINVDEEDTHDEVEAVTTLQHESLHARDISRQGTKGVTKEKEINAHKETIRFLKDWYGRELDSKTKRRIQEEIDEERESISILNAQR